MLRIRDNRSLLALRSTASVGAHDRQFLTRNGMPAHEA
jgi:hypothetical protein